MDTGLLIKRYESEISRLKEQLQNSGYTNAPMQVTFPDWMMSLPLIQDCESKSDPIDRIEGLERILEKQSNDIVEAKMNFQQEIDEINQKLERRSEELRKSQELVAQLRRQISSLQQENSSMGNELEILRQNSVRIHEDAKSAKSTDSQSKNPKWSRYPTPPRDSQWSKHLCNKTKRVYYHNKETKVSVWECPGEIIRELRSQGLRENGSRSQSPNSNPDVVSNVITAFDQVHPVLYSSPSFLPFLSCVISKAIINHFLFPFVLFSLCMTFFNRNVFLLFLTVKTTY